MRTLSRFSAGVVAAALILSVSGCGKDDPKAQPKTTPTPSASATPTPSASATPTPSVAPITEKPTAGNGVICRDTSKMAKFTGPAAQKWGSENVLDAYCEAADLFYGHAITNLTAPKDSYRPIELSFVKDYMTPTAQAGWDKNVASAVQGDEKAIARVNSVTYFNLKAVADLGYTFPDGTTDTPMSVGGGVSKAQTWVNPATPKLPESLGMQFTVTNNLVVSKGGKDYYYEIQRDTTLQMVPSHDKDSAHDWLIHASRSKWEATSAKPKPLVDLIKAG